MSLLRGRVADHSLRTRLLLIVAVFGPGLLAGLSDDDPAGITTYSVLGAKYGYELLWVLLASTVALILFHQLAARMGVATGQGLIGLIRQRYGVRLAAVATVLLVVANIGTACAEYAGVAAGLELFGVSRYLSVPLAGIVVTAFVLRASFHRVEHVLMAVSAIFLTYIASAVLAHPDWGAALRGLVVPRMPGTRDAVLMATATIGTTLAPWGLSFIQSYAVDKKLTEADLRFENADVVIGSLLTGIIGFFVVVACAATLYTHGIAINEASDAVRALEPLAGSLASGLFGVGLVGAALLAAAILPLSTAYSVCEFVGTEAALDDDLRDAPLFYVTMGVVVVVAIGIVLLPGVSLVPVMVLTQVLNAVLLVPLLVFMYFAGRDRDLMGAFATGRRMAAAHLVVIAVVSVCVVALGVLSIA
ncbi:MAG: Nramp family divalent metal transporter [Acidimicrobiales bacterium]